MNQAGTGHQPPDKGKLFWQLHLAGWGGFAVLQFLLGLSYLGFLQDLANRLVLFVVGILCSLVLRFLYRGTAIREMRVAQAGLIMLAASIAIGGLMAVILSGAGAAMGGPAFGFHDRMDWINQVFTWTFILLGWSVLYVAINYRLEVREQRERAVRAESLARQSHLQALRAQLEPHFLFNTLNAISTLVVANDNAGAVRMLNNLGQFLRLTLTRATASEISVAEELEFAHRYAEIQQMRFGERLRIDFDVESGVLDALVPALILQPLVENAVKHGVLSQEQPGSVTIGIHSSGATLNISVQDDGPGFGSGQPRHGVGLGNTVARLDSLYGAAAHLSVGTSAGRGSAVRIDLPLRRAGRVPV